MLSVCQGIGATLVAQRSLRALLLIGGNTFARIVPTHCQPRLADEAESRGFAPGRDTVPWDGSARG